jgi:serine/threonine protein kinase
LPQSPQLKQGEIIKGTYRVLAKLGEGGMGAVYKVEQLVIGRLCALKTINLPSDPQAQQNARQRFQHEARTISKLCHHSIVQVYDFGLTDSGTPYYTMDLIEGKTLLERIKEHGQLEMREALAIFIEVAEGLAYAHSQSVVHRDIKPSNIMIVDHGGQKTGGRVKIVDFGLAKKSEMRPAAGALITAQQTEPELLGSPPYMSPEQCQNGEVDHRSDIYSFGCTLFEALTGVPPFIGESALVISMKHATEEPPSLKQASLGKDFPTDLELIEKRLLAKDPHQRYQDMNVVREDLMAVLQNLEKLPNSTGGGANSNRRGQSAGSDKSQSEGAFERQDNADNGASSPAALRILIFLLPIILGGAALAAVLTIGRHAPGRSASHHDAKQPLVTTEACQNGKGQW